MAVLDDSRPVEPIQDYKIAHEAALYALRQSHIETEQISLPNKITRIVAVIVLLALVAFIGGRVFDQSTLIPEAIMQKKIDNCLFKLEPPEGMRAAWTTLENGELGCELIPK